MNHRTAEGGHPTHKPHDRINVARESGYAGRRDESNSSQDR